MQIADVRDAALDGLPFQLEHQPEHAVGGGMLWPDVDQHVLGAEILPVLSVPIVDAEWHSGRVAGCIHTRGGQRHLYGAKCHFRNPRSPRASRSRMSSGNSP